MKNYSLLDCRDRLLLVMKGTSRNNTRTRSWLVEMMGISDRAVRKVIEFTPEIGNLGDGYFLMTKKQDFIDYMAYLSSRIVAQSNHKARVKNRMLDKAHKVA